MTGWWRRIRGALGMGLTWGVAGFLAGLGMELIHNLWPTPLGSAVDIWPAALAYPAFFGGVAFSAVLGIAGRRRTFHELSLPRVAALGALGGVIVSLIPAALVAVGLASTNQPLWLITLALLGPFTVGSAVAAAGSLALARMAPVPHLPERHGQDSPEKGPQHHRQNQLLTVRRGDPDHKVEPVEE